MRILLELQDLIFIHRPALEFQRMYRSFRKAVEIIRIGCTEITLGGNMKLHRRYDIFRKSSFKDLGSGVLMEIVQSLFQGIFSKCFTIMTYIVKQSSGIAESLPSSVSASNAVWSICCSIVTSSPRYESVPRSVMMFSILLRRSSEPMIHDDAKQNI